MLMLRLPSRVQQSFQTDESAQPAWPASAGKPLAARAPRTMKINRMDSFSGYGVHQAQPFDAGTLLSLNVESFCVRHRTKPVNYYNDEHAIRRPANASGFERRAKRHALKDVLACDEACSHTQAPISVLGSTHGFGKHCCRITSGRAFLWMLWCGDPFQEDSSLTRRVSIPLPGLRPLDRPARPRSSAGFPRHSRVTKHGLSHPYRRADFRDPTRS